MGNTHSVVQEIAKCTVEHLGNESFPGRPTDVTCKENACKQKSFPALLKKFTSKVDGFTFVHFCLKAITSDAKVLYDLRRY